MKKFAWKKCRKMFLEALFFAFEKNFFRVSVQNFGHCRLHEIIGLQLSQCLSANHNPELRCVICTGVTLFALVLHLNCTALSQSESSNFFTCIISGEICGYLSAAGDTVAFGKHQTPQAENNFCHEMGLHHMLTKRLRGSYTTSFPGLSSLAPFGVGR